MLGKRWRGRMAALVVGSIAVVPTGAAPASAEDEGGVQAQIIAGRDAEVGEFPSQAALLFSGVPDPFQAQFCGGAVIDPFWVLNAQAGYVFGADENVRIFGFVNNLLDADDPTLIEEGATSADDALYILHPRSFGVGVEAHF